MPCLHISPITKKKAAAIAMSVSAVFFGGCGSSSDAEDTAAAGFYKDAEIVTSGSSIRQSVLIYDVDSLDEADLTDWYYNYIEEEMLSSGVILSSEDSETGIYANAATDMVYTGISLTKKDNGTYSANITSAARTYEAVDNTLTLVSESEATATPTATATAEATTSAEATASASASATATATPTATPTATATATPEVADDGTYYQCDQCGKHFATEELWLQHIREEHNSQGSYHIYHTS